MRSKRVSRPEELTLGFCPPNRIEPPQKSSISSNVRGRNPERSWINVKFATCRTTADNPLELTNCFYGVVERISVEDVANCSHPLQSRRARCTASASNWTARLLTNAFPFSGARCGRVTAAVLHRPGYLRELGSLSAHGSSSELQHVNQASLRPRPKKGHTIKCANVQTDERRNRCITA